MRLVKILLKLDPSERPNSTEALSHELFAPWSDVKDEPNGRPLTCIFEDAKLSKENWKGK